MISCCIRLGLRAWILSCLAATAALASGVDTRSLFPDTGKTAIRLRARDVSSGTRILVVSLRPGDEDLETLAYFRLNGAARIVSSYVTNGESGDPDLAGSLPQDLAAQRRLETASVLGRLEIDVHYLCLPDPGSVADAASLRRLWRADSLLGKVDDLLNAVKPQVVILSQDREGGSKSILWEYVRRVLRERIEKHRTRGRVDWRVERFWADKGEGKGLAIPAETRDPVLGRSYGDIARGLDSGYVSQRVQRSLRRVQARYLSGLDPRGKAPARLSLTGALDPGIPAPLRGLHRTLRSFAVDIERGDAPRKALHERMATIMGSVDSALVARQDRAGTARQILIDWKGALENLRNALLGVTVEYSISEEILTERQITSVRIEQVAGLSQGGSTEVYFPAAANGWILNEGLTSRTNLTVPGEYRLITPERVVYDLPWSANNLGQAVPVRPVMFYLLHKGKSRAESFVYRIALPFRYAPRFTVEVLTPIVRRFPGEYVVARLTNHSRDGVRDTIAVKDSLVLSTGIPFRLNGKESSATATLRLQWLDTLAHETQLIPISIGGEEVARFAARQFHADVDTAKRVLLLAAGERTPAADALRRLGLPHLRVARTVADLEASLGACDVLVMDTRATSLTPEPGALRPILEKFTEQGKHVVIFSQDDVSWNANPLWDRISLTRDPTLAADIEVKRDPLHIGMRAPNALTDADFKDWVFARGHNTVRVENPSGVEIPLLTGDRRPLVVTAPVHSGRMTYVELALGPQWMSIHPGSFRILANLLSL